MPILTPDACDHAGRAADHVLALVVAENPAYTVTADLHDAVVNVVQAVARALVVSSG